MSHGSQFPHVRLRRTRRTAAMRRSFRETFTPPSALVLPVFVKAGLEACEPIPSLPGVVQHPPAAVAGVAREIRDAGIGGVILFGVPEYKDGEGSGGWDPDGPVPTAARTIRDAVGDEVVVWADVCQCEYTDHGNCGPLDPQGVVDNDAAVDAYVRDSVAYAAAGVDLIAPSGMMDGQVAGIRAGLDDAGHRDVGIVAYAAKFASAFYGPFRDAAESGLVDGDRASHQMDVANRREARRELAFDAAEGADALMVKPALTALDVIADARAAFDLPLAAYQVSGEYAMLHAAAEQGWIDADDALLETLTAIRRAGADIVLTYAALALAHRLD
ncbi:MAG: porphobilinogen synthase [Nitriliruptoraceae bacterium]